MIDRLWYENVPLPSLLRQARDVYRDAVRQALSDTGADDLPRNGAFVLTGLDQGVPESKFSPQAEVVATLGMSKQAASQLIDTLVLRDYLERRIDPEDRRRMELRLTDRGRAAALAIQAATDAIEAGVAQLITAEQLRGLRAGLAAFKELSGGA
jgi:DNA-binding MarR family transcriptional regulator